MIQIQNISSVNHVLPCATLGQAQAETLRLGQIEKNERLWLTDGFFTHVDLGETGQDVAMIAFANAGYLADFPQDKKSGDIRLKDWLTGEIFSVEVKTSRRDSQGRFQFGMKRRRPNGGYKTDVAHSDFALLLAVCDEIIPFVIPAEICPTCIAIPGNPKTYAGKWAQYRRAAL